MEVQEKVDERPIMAFISRRLQDKKKKLSEIKILEKNVKNGKTISKEEQKRIERKGDLIAEVNELQNVKMLLPEAIKEELSSKFHDDSDGSKTDESSADNDWIADENTPAQVDPSESAKTAESGEPSMTHSQAQLEVDQNIEKQFYRFLKRYKLEADDKPFYHGDALALVSRRSLRVQYSDICMQDKTLAMQICADYERLKPTITEAVKRFAREVLKKSIKGLTPRKANAANANVENLNLSLVGKPKSHQMLDTFLQPRSIVMVDEEVHTHKENPMKTPSVIGCALLMGILQDLITKHLQGLSCNGQLGIENVEVYNGDRYVITSPLIRYCLGSPEWAAACKKDFESYSDSFVLLFETAGEYPPYMFEFKTSLLTVPVNVLQNREECFAFHEFMLHHMIAKPLPVRAALVSGIHSCCKAFDLYDPVAPFKDILHELHQEVSQLGLWTDSVRQSGNELMKKLLSKRLKNGVEIECKYPDDFESMVTYLRVLNYHGSDYTKERKKKNQGKPRSRRRNGASTSQQLEEPDEPQVQRLKLLNELELIGARHLGPHVLEMIYTLLRKKAMTGMLLPVWKAFKSCKLSGQGP